MDIKEIINQRYAMPDASLDKLRQCLTEVSYPKGFQVLEYGKIEKDIFFIKKGIVRAYTSVEGKEITFWVGKEGATIVSMKGYVNDEPGYETMELMENSVLYVLERKKLKELFLKDLHIANWGRRYAEMELLAAEERLTTWKSAVPQWQAAPFPHNAAPNWRCASLPKTVLSVFSFPICTRPNLSI